MSRCAWSLPAHPLSLNWPSAPPLLLSAAGRGAPILPLAFRPAEEAAARPSRRSGATSQARARSAWLLNNWHRRWHEGAGTGIALGSRACASRKIHADRRVVASGQRADKLRAHGRPRDTGPSLRSIDMIKSISASMSASFCARESPCCQKTVQP